MISLALAALLMCAQDLPKAADGLQVREVVRLGLATGLTAYDAAYLWLARALGMPLVTLDKTLGAHAKNF